MGEEKVLKSSRFSKLCSSKFSKIVLVTIGVFLFLFLTVWPLFLGHLTENKFNSIITSIKESGGSKFDISGEYKRSFFSGNGQIQIKILNVNQSGVITIASEACHYWPFIKTIISFDKTFVENYTSLKDISPTIKVKSCFSFFGSIQNIFESDLFNYSYELSDKKTKNILELKDLKGELSFNSELNLKNFNFKSKEISFSKLVKGEPTDKLEKSDKETNKPQVQAGVNGAGLSTDKNHRYLLIDQFSNTLKLDLKKQYFDGDFSLQFERYVDSGGKEWGPFESELKFQNLANEIIDSFKKILADVSTASNNGDPNSSEDLRVKLLGRSMTALPSLIKFSPKIELTKFKLKTEKGDLESNALFSIPKSSGGILSFLSTMNILFDLKSPEFLYHLMFTKYYLISKQLKDTAPNLLPKEGSIANGSPASSLFDFGKIAGNNSPAATTAATETKSEASNNSTEDAEKQLKFLEESKGEATKLLETAYQSKYLIKGNDRTEFKFEYKEGSMKLNGEPFSFTGKN